MKLLSSRGADIGVEATLGSNGADGARGEGREVGCAGKSPGPRGCVGQPNKNSRQLGELLDRATRAKKSKFHGFTPTIPSSARALLNSYNHTEDKVGLN